MPTKYYLAIADRVPDEVNWSILFPAFPGVTSVAEDFADVVRQAKDALETVVEDMEQDGAPLPPSIEDSTMPAIDLGAYHDPRTLVVPVDVVR